MCQALVIWFLSLFPGVALASTYESIFPTAELAVVKEDVTSMATWIIGVMVSLCALALLVRLMGSR